MKKEELKIQAEELDESALEEIAGGIQRTTYKIQPVVEQVKLPHQPADEITPIIRPKTSKI